MSGGSKLENSGSTEFLRVQQGPGQDSQIESQFDSGIHDSGQAAARRRHFQIKITFDARRITKRVSQTEARLEVLSED